VLPIKTSCRCGGAGKMRIDDPQTPRYSVVCERCKVSTERSWYTMTVALLDWEAFVQTGRVVNMPERKKEAPYVELTEEERKAIAALVAYAEQHPVSLGDLQRQMAGRGASPEVNPLRVLKLRDYRIVFTIEHQPMGWCRHASLSFNRAKPQSPAESRALLSALGYQFDSSTAIDKTARWNEEGHTITGEAFAAVNYVQAIEGHFAPPVVTPATEERIN
jgi:hypothetical protein